MKPRIIKLTCPNRTIQFFEEDYLSYEFKSCAMIHKCKCNICIKYFIIIYLTDGSILSTYFMGIREAEHFEKLLIGKLRGPRKSKKIKNKSKKSC